MTHILPDAQAAHAPAVGDTLGVIEQVVECLVLVAVSMLALHRDLGDGERTPATDRRRRIRCLTSSAKGYPLRMSEPTSITVERTIPAPAKDLFDILSNTHRHTELDGSGFVKGLVHGDRLDHVGQKFTMNMSGDHMGGDYQTDNIVSAYDAKTMIGWKTAPAGIEPPGWEWLWQLKSEGSNATTVSITYDWSKVTDKELLKKISFPLVPESSLDRSLVKLASAAIAT